MKLNEARRGGALLELVNEYFQGHFVDFVLNLIGILCESVIIIKSNHINISQPERCK